MFMYHTESMHGTTQELIKRYKSSMIKIYVIACQDFLCLKVIHQNHSQEGNKSDHFLFSISRKSLSELIS